MPHVVRGFALEKERTHPRAEMRSLWMDTTRGFTLRPTEDRNMKKRRRKRYPDKDEISGPPIQVDQAELDKQSQIVARLTAKVIARVSAIQDPLPSDPFDCIEELEQRKFNLLDASVDLENNRGILNRLVVKPAKTEQAK